MKNPCLLFTFLLLSTAALAQPISIGVFGGLSAYSGDLESRIFPKNVSNGAIGFTVNYELQEQIMLRAGFTYSIVGGADRYSNDTAHINRNLSFETTIVEFSAMGEYYLMNLYDRKFSPYIFVGLAVFHFNPYAYDQNSQRVFLKPLSTEGQGLAGYPDRKPYSLTQIAIPFGGGIKFAVTDKLRVGLEMGIRKLFTDYLDDVSKNYVDPNDLFAAKGQLAVDMSYRGGEVATGSPTYPSKQVQRGNPNTKDYYYFTGIHLTYALGEGGAGGFSRGGTHKSRTGCPANPR